MGAGEIANHSLDPKSLEGQVPFIELTSNYQHTNFFRRTWMPISDIPEPPRFRSILPHFRLLSDEEPHILIRPLRLWDILLDEPLYVHTKQESWIEEKFDFLKPSLRRFREIKKLGKLKMIILKEEDFEAMTQLRLEMLENRVPEAATQLLFVQLINDLLKQNVYRLWNHKMSEMFV